MLLIAALLTMSPVQQVEISPAARAVIARRAELPVADWIAQLTALADGGDASAAQLLGELHQRGAAGVARDETRACGYFEKSAATRGDGAQNLANCYFHGRGRPRDLARARPLYAAAHDRGSPSAGCALGGMLIRGDGGAVDVPRGLALCHAGAQAGDANAQTDYGGYLLAGQVTQRDAVEARKWLFAAAQQRQANAAFLLGQIYWNGDSVAKDNIIAARWWKVAYDGGRTDAALLLGREAVTRVPIMDGGRQAFDRGALDDARKWLAIAAKSDPTEQGRASAAKMLPTFDEIAASLP